MFKKILGTILLVWLIASQNIACAESKNISVWINEVLPNPKGKDLNQEWIELYNPTNTDINLGGWTIETGKPHKLSNSLIIKNKNFLILTKANSKITLKNTQNTIKLIDQNGNIIDEITHNSAPEGLSYNKIIIKKDSLTKTDLSWTSPSMNSENPIYYEIKGIVSVEPKISEENYNYFEILYPPGTLRILIPEEFKISVLQGLMTKDTGLNLLVEKLNNNLTLKDFRISKTAVSPIPAEQTINTLKNWHYYLAIPIVVLITFLYYAFKAS